MTYARFTCVMLFLALNADAVAAQATITGVVRDSAGAPIAGADVSIVGVKKSTTTKEDGRYTLKGLRPGGSLVHVRAVGYQAVTGKVELTAGSREFDIVLQAASVALEPIVVTGRSSRPGGFGVASFEERRSLGLGRFIDSAELRRNEHVRLGDLIGRISGIQVQRSRTGAFAVSLSRVGPNGEKCPVSVMLDGAMIYRSSGIELVGLPTAPNPPIDLNALLGTNDLQAVEIYRRASEVPTEFDPRNAACGLIVLWSRRAR